MAIIIVRGRERAAINSMKIRSPNHWMSELLHNQLCNGKIKQSSIIGRSFVSFRPMYFVQLTIDEHTVGEIRLNEESNPLI